MLTFLENARTAQYGDRQDPVDYSQDRFRVGHRYDRDTRLQGLILVGLAYLYGASQFREFFYTAPPWLALLCIVALLAGLQKLSEIDVCKQNAGLLVNPEHFGPRVRRLLKRLTLAGVCWSFLVFAVMFVARSKGVTFDGVRIPFLYSFDDWPGVLAIIRLFLGIVLHGLAAASFGALLQWFWDDHALTEPI